MGVTNERAEKAINGLARIQKHRDAWREYAYGKREKPTDYLDGNKVDRGPTALDRLAQALQRLINNLPESELDLARAVWGNTNVRVVLDMIQEGRDALAASVFYPSPSVISEVLGVPDGTVRDSGDPAQPTEKKANLLNSWDEELRR